MSDIDAAHRRILTDFGVQQMKLNPAGIGNECTHWIYAALFEARALDFDRTLHIAQTLPHYTWGTIVSNDHVQRGDIAQFHGWQNTFFIYQTDPAGNASYLTQTFIRGPNHTGMVFITPKNGSYYQLESHLTDPTDTHMHVRGNTIYYDNFAIALTAADLKQMRGSASWPADVNGGDIKDMLERIDWTGMRKQFSLDLLTATNLQTRVTRAKSSSPLSVKGRDIACLFIARSTGYLRFSCPQASTARLNMTAAQLADEKAKLIHMMIRTGRTGGSPTEDQYGGDNKAQRLHDNRFDWSYRPSP